MFAVAPLIALAEIAAPMVAAVPAAPVLRVEPVTTLVSAQYLLLAEV
jgi:hypothetical protein